MKLLTAFFILASFFLQGCSSYDSQIVQARRDYIDNKISQKEYDAKVASLTDQKAKSQQRWAAVAASLAAAGQAMNQQSANTNVGAGVSSSPPLVTSSIQNLYWLEGASIVANDGKFLGKITKNSYASDSIGNEFGQYGSTMSRSSIFNTVSQYGSTVSSLSPWNSFSSTPPKIITADGQRWAFLTVNEFKSPRVDTYVVVAYVRSQ